MVKRYVLLSLIAVLTVTGICSPVHAQGVYTVTNTDDSGTGSLRWAIEQANTNPGTDTISFAIPGEGVQTISPTSPLPA
ncbi:MAG: 3-dehydroshikimate dehydratase, partial [Anaerolineae bacterium]|nr:3-dehydroshikimate dehydratase [Anaerolineae bacterium]